MTDHDPSDIVVNPLPLRNRIGFRLLVMILVVISLLAAFSWAIRYRALDSQNHQEVDARLDEINLSHVPALAENLWTLNGSLLKINLKGLVDLKEVSYARITDVNNRIVAEVVDEKIKRGPETVSRAYPLNHKYNDTVHHLGDLFVEVSLEPGKERARNALVYDIGSFVVRLLFLAIILLIGIRLLVVKPLSEFAAYAKRFRPDMLGEPIEVSRWRFWGKAEDELDQVVAAFNTMQQDLAAVYLQLQTANKALAADILKQQLAEKSLREAHDRLVSLLNSLDSIVYVTDLTTNKVLFINECTRRIFGDVEGKICWQAFQQGQTGPCPFCTNDRLLDSEGRPVGIIAWESQNTVNGRWYDVRDRAIFWENQKLVRLEIATDITARKAEEMILVRSKEELEARDRERTVELSQTYEQLLHAEKLAAVGKLAASVAHEFNNPLFGIRNVLKGIERRAVLAAEDQELVAMAVRECDRIKELIAKLQQFNRPTSGTFSMVDIHQAIKDMILLCNKKMSSRGITIAAELASDLPRIEAIEDQIKQVILNLLNNAEEAVANDTGHIRIYTELCHATVVVWIEDNGIGMTKETEQHIFEPFFTTKPAVKGTGLGLSISYGIIKRHGGNLTVRSTFGKGSTFIVSLPIRQEKRDEQGADSSG